MEKDEKIDISVIVCCYNPQLIQLKNTIKSIEKQSSVKKEIIISDDGSKLNYLDELKKWCNENNYHNIKFNFLNKNFGTVYNIFSALPLCSAKYVKTISPGDYLFDEFSLSKYVNCFLEKKCDMIFSDAIYYNNNSILSNKYKSYSDQCFNTFDNKKLKKYYCDYNAFFLGATFAIKKELYYTILNRFVGRIKYIEDNPLVTMLLKEKYSVYGLCEPLVWYEFGTGVSSNLSFQTRFLSDFENCCSFLVEYYNDIEIKRITMKYKVIFMSKIKKLLFFLFRCPNILFFKIFKKKNKKYAHIEYSMLEKIIS